MSGGERGDVRYAQWEAGGARVGREGRRKQREEREGKTRKGNRDFVVSESRDR